MQVVEDSQYGRLSLEDPPTRAGLKEALDASPYAWDTSDIGIHVYGVSVSNPDTEGNANISIYFREDTTEYIHASADEATHRDLMVGLANFASDVLDTMVEGVYEPEYQFEVIPDDSEEEAPELLQILVELFDEDVYRGEYGNLHMPCEVMGYVFIVYEDGRALPWHEAGWDTGEDAEMFTTYLTDRWEQEQQIGS